MQTRRVFAAALVTAVACSLASLPAQTPAPRARISEMTRTIPTYPFSEPNPIPILAKDTRLYPYFSFEGYAAESTPKPWKVVTLENEWIQVKVLPEVGGKVWGARVKKTGHDFIYTNDAIKFRNVALRGPWTSGGIEFNFGVVGHTPSTATPVDYVIRENADGSVSCIVGTMDLPSHTEWRVEIRLPADKAAFETNVLWHNPTTLEQPYYNWMTAAAFAKDDLVMSIPGNAYLDHPGPRHDWPTDAAGHFLPGYANNKFGSNKSFHVVGRLQDAFGGYYADAGFGFGHWARHEEMPGQKLWLWALSRAGGIWEDLLTDKMGQYVEYQAGRLLVQYTPGGRETPIRQAGFDPMATDRWSETWFPLEGIGGLTEASSDGALAVTEHADRITVGVSSFVSATDTLKVWMGDRLVLARDVTFAPLEPVVLDVPRPAGAAYRVELPALRLSFSSDTSTRTLSRPFESDAAAAHAIPAADRLVFEARELVQARRYDQARPLVEKVLRASAWHHDGLLAMADLEYRRARYAEGLVFATRALRIDTYDAGANMIAANLYRALGRTADARDAYGWAARSLTYRAAANTALADLALERGDWTEAARYAEIALDYNRLNLTAWEALAIAARKMDDRALADETARTIVALDPLNHFVRAERMIAVRSPAASASFLAGLRSEFPDESRMELAAGYVRRGLTDDALAVLGTGGPGPENPVIRAWRAALSHNRNLLNGVPDVTLVFPYRHETLPVLLQAARDTGHWTWAYLAALNLWAFDRGDEALTLLTPFRDPGASVFFATRAALRLKADPADRTGAAEADLKHVTAHALRNRPLHLPLIQFYQSKARWADALAASTAALEWFPGDFNLQIMHARSLVRLQRSAEALATLDAARVLPSEGARESHQLYVQAHLLAALANIDATKLEEAYTHLTAALEWPEHLGQGKPYDPEERLIRFLMARIDQRRGRTAEAMKNYKAVAGATNPAGALTPLDLVAIPALKAVGRSADVDRIMLPAAARPATDPGVKQAARALARGASIAALAGRFPRTFGDLDGSLLTRALALSVR